MKGRSKKEPGGQTYLSPDNAAIVIRLYEDRDQDEVWRLHVEAQTELGFPYDIPEIDGDLKQIPQAYGQAGAQFWVADAGAGPIATAGVRRVDTETAELKRMRVTARYRRKGVAEHLLRAAERFCREHGYTRIVLETTGRQEAARALYEKNGYKPSGTRLLGTFTAYDYVKELT